MIVTPRPKSRSYTTWIACLRFGSRSDSFPGRRNWRQTSGLRRPDTTTSWWFSVSSGLNTIEDDAVITSSLPASTWASSRPFSIEAKSEGIVDWRWCIWLVNSGSDSVYASNNKKRTVWEKFSHAKRSFSGERWLVVYTTFFQSL